MVLIFNRNQPSLQLSFIGKWKHLFISSAKVCPGMASQTQNILLESGQIKPQGVKLVLVLVHIHMYIYICI